MSKQCEKVDRVIAAIEEKKRKGEVDPKYILELIKKL